MEIPSAKMNVPWELAQEGDPVEERDDNPDDDEYRAEKNDHFSDLIVHACLALPPVRGRGYTIEAG